MRKKMKEVLQRTRAAASDESTTSSAPEVADPPSGEVVRALPAADAAALRDRYLRGRFADAVALVFDHDPSLQSAMLLVAQYWDDEAHDAVHHEVVWSELETPDLAAARHAGWNGDAVNLGGRRQLRWAPLDEPWGPDGHQWNENGYSIPLFAGFCIEGASQDDDPLENYAAVAVYRRGERGVDVEFVGKVIRPWLEGVMGEWARSDPAAQRGAIERWVEKGA